MKKNNSSIESAAVVYAAWRLLHMEKNGLLEKTSVSDKAVNVKKSDDIAFASAIKVLEQKSISVIRLTSTPKNAKAIEIAGSKIIERFFATGLHRVGVVPPLLFACTLYAWFIESGKQHPMITSSFSDQALYDGVFGSIEMADEVNWSSHIGAASIALSLSPSM